MDWKEAMALFTPGDRLVSIRTMIRATVPVKSNLTLLR